MGGLAGLGTACTDGPPGIIVPIFGGRDGASEAIGGCMDGVIIVGSCDALPPPALARGDEPGEEVRLVFTRGDTWCDSTPALTVVEGEACERPLGSGGSLCLAAVAELPVVSLLPWCQWAMSAVAVRATEPLPGNGGSEC